MKKYRLPTLKEDPKFWEIQGRRKVFRLMNFLIKKRRCFMCKYKLKEPPIKKIPMGELRFEDIFSGEFLFHLNSTHGLWPEVVAHIFKDTEKQRRSLEKYLCKKKKS